MFGVNDVYGDKLSRTTAGLWAGWLGVLVAMSILMPAADALEPTKRLTQYTHRFWKSGDGLPQNTVFDIAQTPEGNLWLATTAGLVRFDGVRMTVFTRANTEQLSIDQIYALEVDGDGDLWIGTNGGGLLRYRDGDFERIGAVEESLGGRISALASNPDGSLCIGSYDRGFGRWDSDGVEVFDANRGLPAGVIFAVESDGDAGCWVGILGGGLHHLDEQDLKSFSTADGLPSASIWGLHRTADGDLWIGTDRGLAKLHDGEVETWTIADGLSSNRVKTVFEDRDGNVWIGTQGGGLNRWSGGRFEALPATSGEVVWSLLEDREGSLWIGSLSIGLHQLVDRPFVAFSVEEGLTSRQIHSLLEDDEGAIWFTTNSGLHRFHRGEVENWTTADGLVTDTGWALALDHRDRLLVGTNAGGVDRFDRQARVHLPPILDGVPAGQVLSLLEDRAGALWIGTAGGLSRHQDGEVIRYTAADGLPHRRVEALLEDRSGRIWIGTLGGLSQFADGGFTTLTVNDGLPNNRVRILYEDTDGTLWIGTYGGGLARWRDGHLASFTTYDGLLSDSLTGIVDDGLGNLWLSSAQGIFRVSKSELEAFAEGKRQRIFSDRFGRHDGLKSSECLSWPPTSLRARDGRLWFATMNGIAVVDPRAITLSSPPEVILQTVNVDGTPIHRLQAPRLGPESRSFEFQFAAATLAAPEKIRYRYRLRGHDSSWIDAGTMPAAFYASLPAGSYVFEVMASDEFGRWGGTPASFVFSVRPRFTQTWTFFVLCALALLALGFSVQQARVLRLARRKQELDRIAREAVAQVKVLSGLLPICSRCKMIRDDEGYWNELEIFIDQHSEASFTHGICPSCSKEYLQNLSSEADAMPQIRPSRRSAG